MKKIITLSALILSTVNIQAQYQVQNSGFEEWEKVVYSYKNWVGQTKTKEGVEPLYWNSFLTGTGSLKSTAANNQLEQVSDVRPGSNGKSAAKLFAAKVLGVAVAQGNLTTGCINMGSMSPSDATGNYNYTNLDDPNLRQAFSGKPDAMHVWVKFYTPEAKNLAKVNTILHTDGYYQDPEANNISATLVAKAEKVDIATSDEWQELIIPFNYSAEVTPAYALISFATNAVPGGGTESDYMIVDDLEYLYYSELASLNYDGQDYFQQGNTNYTIDALYDESKLTCTSNGKGATIEKSYDEASAVLTITVKGNDVSVNSSNVHTYKIQFAKPQPVITSYTNSLLVNAFGNYAEPTENTIDLIQEVDGSYSFALKNFAFSGMPMGDIKVVNLDRKENDGTVTYSAENQMVFIQGLDQEVPVTLEANQKGKDLTADILIALSPGAIVKVTFLPLLEITGEDQLATSADRYNVIMSRSFVEGWNTICLPYATTAAALNAQSVQRFASVDETGLNFAEVETLEANQPYLVYFDKVTETPVYQVAEITSTTPVSVTKGDYTFVGSYDAVMSMSGKYGIATVDNVQKIILGGTNSTLKATRAYFTKKGEQPAQVRINLFGMGGDGEGTTGIDQIVNGGAQTYDVYTLQGVQVLKGAASLNGLQKGIYIVNGKKVVIK